MNALDFICGQLLSFDRMREKRRSFRQRSLRPRAAHRYLPFLPKERIMEQQLLIIAFVIISLIANMTVMNTSE